MKSARLLILVFVAGLSLLAALLEGTGGTERLTGVSFCPRVGAFSPPGRRFRLETLPMASALSRDGKFLLGV